MSAFTEVASGSSNGVNDEKCPICLGNLETKNTKTECGHTFCQDCLEKWEEEHNTCPVCRRTNFRKELKTNIDGYTINVHNYLYNTSSDSNFNIYTWHTSNVESIQYYTKTYIFENNDRNASMRVPSPIPRPHKRSKVRFYNKFPRNNKHR